MSNLPLARQALELALTVAKPSDKDKAIRLALSHMSREAGSRKPAAEKSPDWTPDEDQPRHHETDQD